MKLKLTGFLFLLFSTFSFQAVAEHDGLKKITLQGKLKNGTSQQVSIKEIEQVGTHQFNVYNPYEKKKENYTGVLINDFVEAFGTPETTSIRLTAIDDYAVTITKDHWTKFRILLVTKTNGIYIDYSTRGPIRIVFPDYDKNNRIYEPHLSKWAWMINQIEFND